MERMKIGRTMQASVRPPDSTEKPKPNAIQKKALPNSPKTIDGTPARTSKLRRTKRPKTFWSEVNSASSIAVPVPRGTETAMHTPSIRTVETMIGPMPPSRPASSGLEVKNSQESCPAPRQTMSPSSQRNIIVTEAAAAHTRMVASRSLRMLGPFLTVDSPLADHLCCGHECHNHYRKQQSTDEECRAVVARRVGHLQGDVGCQGSHGAKWALGRLYYVAADHENGHGLADGPTGSEYHRGKKS